MINKKLLLIVAFISTTLIPMNAVTIFGVNSTDLFEIDTNSGAVSRVGSLGISLNFFSGVEMTQDGTLFVRQQGGHLHTVDTTTGQATLVGSSSVGTGIISMADLGNNTLGAVDANGFFFEINTLDGSTTELGRINIGQQFGLASTVADTAVLDGGAIIPQGTQITAAFGSLNFNPIGGGPINFRNQGGTGLSISIGSDGAIYSLTTGNELNRIDGVTGERTVIATLDVSGISSGGDILGLASVAGDPTATVPEPSTYAMILFGLFAFTFYHRKNA